MNFSSLEGIREQGVRLMDKDSKGTEDPEFEKRNYEITFDVTSRRTICVSAGTILQAIEALSEEYKSHSQGGDDIDVITIREVS